jgi:hypothetical protein
VAKRLIILLGIALIASGCLDEPGTGAKNPDIPDEGLNIGKFTVSDNTLAPGQEASVTLTLKNFNEKSVKFHDIKLLNTGEALDTTKTGSNCGEGSEIGERKGEIIGTKECVWTVETKGVEDFMSKNIPMTLFLNYSMSSTSKPIKVTFKNITDISSSGEVKGSYSNTEVKINWETKSPLPYNGNSTIDFEVKNVGPGKVEGKNYRFDYEPEDVFVGDCKNNEEREPITGENLEFTCRLSSEGPGEQTTENLFITTNYTYVRQVQKNIKLVNLEQ